MAHGATMGDREVSKSRTCARDRCMNLNRSNFPFLKTVV